MNRLEKYNAVIYSCIAGLLYFIINLKYMFSFTAPSDPLQYVLPSLYPEMGFEFLDRVVLWLWIRFVANLPIPPEYIGGVATLLLSTFTLVVGSWYLSKKVNMIASGFFIFLYTLSPSILGISSYTYPMQLLTFILLLTVVGVDYVKNIPKALFIAGFGFIFIIFSKIQGYSFAFLILVYLIYYSRNTNDMIKNIAFAISGGVVAFFLLFFTIYIIDGYEILVNLFSSYFNETASVQFKGRNLGEFPKFYTYLLEPTAIIAVFAIFFVWFKKIFSPLRLIAIVAMIQLVGLLSIYLITMRGGPVISNYVIDSYTLGLIVFSGIIGILLNNVSYKNSLSIYFLIIIYISFTYISINIKAGNSVYNPLYILTNEYAQYAAYLSYFGLLIMIYYILKQNRIGILYLSIIIIVGTVLYRSSEGVKDAKFRRMYNLGYHEISKQINGTEITKGSVWVSFKLNRSNTSVGTKGLERVYKAFYNQKSDLIFSASSPLYFNTILTNRLDLLLKYSDNPQIVVSAEYKNLNQKAKILASEISSIKELNIKVGGRVGDCYIDFNNKDIIKIFPIDTVDNFKVQLDYSQDSFKDDTINLVSDKVLIGKGYSVNLFIQYSLFEKWHRETLFLRHDNENNILSLKIPSGAKKVSYGWIVNSKNSTDAIILPAITVIKTKDMINIKSDDVNVINMPIAKGNI